MNTKMQISLLYDFYGELLKPSQQKVVELCVNEDMSLSEVAALLSISRQGVRDALSRAERKLSRYEETLGLYRRYRESGLIADEIIKNAEKIRTLSKDEEISALAMDIRLAAQKLRDRED